MNENTLHELARLFMVQFDFEQMSLDEYLVEHSDELTEEQYKLGYYILSLFDKDLSDNREVLEKAGIYLSVDDEDDLIYMVKQIVAHENQDELIDYIDGVVVWEKMELEFTCKEFLEQIGYNGNEF
jgi:hypothetical protein